MVSLVWFSCCLEGGLENNETEFGIPAAHWGHVGSMFQFGQLHFSVVSSLLANGGGFDVMLMRIMMRCSLSWHFNLEQCRTSYIVKHYIFSGCPSSESVGGKTRLILWTRLGSEIESSNSLGLSPVVKVLCFRVSYGLQSRRWLGCGHLKAWRRQDSCSSSCDRWQDGRIQFLVAIELRGLRFLAGCWQETTLSS